MIQQRETRRGTMGDKGGQDPREGGHTIQHQGGHLKKALRTPNSTLLGEQEGRQGDTRGDNGRQGETKGDKGRQEETRPSGRRTHHPIKRNKKGDKGGQGETREDKTLGNADKSSDKGKQ